MTRCRACGAPIIWIKTASGKAMPCDAKPIVYRKEPGAKEKVVTPNGEVLSCVLDGPAEEMTGIGYIPHWATCPQANKFRRKI